MSREEEALRGPEAVGCGKPSLQCIWPRGEASWTHRVLSAKSPGQQSAIAVASIR